MKIRKYDALVMLSWAALVVMLSWIFAGKSADDFFITYRYAWNLSHGNGFVFNPGERVFGLTNPGLGLLLAALTIITNVPIHILGTALFGAGLWGLVTLLLLSERDVAGRIRTAVGGTLVVGSTFIWINNGSEAVIVLLLLGLSERASTSHPLVAGILAGIAVWFRPDALLGLILLLCFVWVRQRRLPFRLLAAATSTVILGMVLAWFYWGALLPATLEAKRMMAESRAESWSGPVRFWQRSGRILLRHWGSGLPLVVSLGLAGQWPLISRSGNALRLVCLFGIASAVAYPVLGVPFFPWYAIPAVIALFYGLAALCVELALVVGKWCLASGYSRARIPLMVGTMVLMLLGPVGLVLETGLPWLARFKGYGRYETYKKAAEWVKEHSGAKDRLAYGEIGVLAYFSERPMDDLMGLTTPRSLPFVLAGDGEGAFLAAPPEYFFEHPEGPHRGLVNRKWFLEAYEPVAVVPPAPGDGSSMKIFRRREGARLPDPRPPRRQSPR